MKAESAAKGRRMRADVEATATGKIRARSLQKEADAIHAATAQAASDDMAREARLERDIEAARAKGKAASKSDLGLLDCAKLYDSCEDEFGKASRKFSAAGTEVLAIRVNKVFAEAFKKEAAQMNISASDLFVRMWVGFWSCNELRVIENTLEAAFRGKPGMREKFDAFLRKYKGFGVDDFEKVEVDYRSSKGKKIARAKLERKTGG